MRKAFSSSNDFIKKSSFEDLSFSFYQLKNKDFQLKIKNSNSEKLH
jgi:hypothetical protein